MARETLLVRHSDAEHKNTIQRYLVFWRRTVKKTHVQKRRKQGNKTKQDRRQELLLDKCGIREIARTGIFKPSATRWLAIAFHVQYEISRVDVYARWTREIDEMTFARNCSEWLRDFMQLCDNPTWPRLWHRMYVNALSLMLRVN